MDILANIALIIAIIIGSIWLISVVAYIVLAVVTVIQKVKIDREIDRAVKNTPGKAKKHDNHNPQK